MQNKPIRTENVCAIRTFFQQYRSFIKYISYQTMQKFKLRVIKISKNINFSHCL